MYSIIMYVHIDLSPLCNEPLRTYVRNSLRPTDEILLRGCPLNSIGTTEMFLYSGGYFKRGSIVR